MRDSPPSSATRRRMATRLAALLLTTTIMWLTPQPPAIPQTPGTPQTLAIPQPLATRQTLAIPQTPATPQPLAIPQATAVPQPPPTPQPTSTEPQPTPQPTPTEPHLRPPPPTESRTLPSPHTWPGALPRPQARPIPHTWSWPLPTRPHILRAFTPPPAPWLSGHRGTDLAAAPGTPVLSAGPGTIGHAGPIADRSVVTVIHPNGLRTTYLPVQPSVRPGQQVTTGTLLGVLQDAPGHCRVSCLHWGLIRTRQYLDPLLLIGFGQVRLFPHWPSPPSSPPSNRMAS
ncbi:peptidoglycan DD-metalloendopeptidase family protein [Nonomuraea sp. NPDC050663]|uniref:M23 family metallopeptidase n=1 Tax=Nonomuraea sp. NPDC050663 TaxID=3364370 RepID=UPI00379C2448